jgi:hypothetical protein
MNLELITRKAIGMASALSNNGNGEIIGPVAAALITQALTQDEVKDALLAWNGPEKNK